MKLIPLGPNGVEGTATVDDKDFKRLSKYRWRFDDFAQYPYTHACWKGSKRPRVIRMHQMIIDVPKGFQCDHKDRDRFNNTRSNLRVCDQFQQMQNRQKTKRPCSSHYKGVYWLKEPKIFRCGIYANKKHYHLGRFADERDAALSYNAACRILHGDFACLNVL